MGGRRRSLGALAGRPGTAASGPGPGGPEGAGAVPSAGGRRGASRGQPGGLPLPTGSLGWLGPLGLHPAGGHMPGDRCLVGYEGSGLGWGDTPMGPSGYPGWWWVLPHGGVKCWGWRCHPLLGGPGGTTADLGLYLVSLPQSSRMNFNEHVPAECLHPENSTAPLNPKSPRIRVCHGAWGPYPAGAVQRDLGWHWGHLTLVTLNSW